MQCLILAGGLATRMRPLTENIPKSLLPINGRPFIDYQMNWLAREGVASVVVSIGHLGSQIKEHLGCGSRFGIRCTYVDEGEIRRGTGGAVRFAFKQGALEDNFCVLYGDSYLPVQIGPIWKAFIEGGKPALMTVFKNEAKWEESNVVFEEGILKRYEKGVRGDPKFKYVDYGLMLFSTRFVSGYLSDNIPQDLAPALNRLSLQGELAGYEVFQRFYEVGSPGGMQELSNYLINESVVNEF